MKYNANQSEVQLNSFLEQKKDTYLELELRPQGDNTAIGGNAVNLCTVMVHGNEYYFGGISEAFYDRMVTTYDWREAAVKELKRKRHKAVKV